MLMSEGDPFFPRACDSCGAALSIVADGGFSQIYNEAYLILEGGYGSFVDDITHPNSEPYRFVLCETCALRLCHGFRLFAPLREHHTSTVCECPDRPARDEHGFPLTCDCPVCQDGAALGTVRQ